MYTCDFGDPLQPGDREGHSHPQVCPHQQQTITDQQTADQHSLVPCRTRKASIASVSINLLNFPLMNMHIYAAFHTREQHC